MSFKPLDPRIIRLLTKHEEDILTPRAEKRTAAIATAPCPRCGGEMHQSLNSRHIFTPDEPLPRTLGECKECGYCYDPNSGIVLNVGDPRKSDNLFDPHEATEPKR
jgi:hypothetical protein